MMMLLSNTSEPQTELTLSLMKSLVEQFANIRFEGVLMYVILMLIAGYICLEGYGIYKMALGFIGFGVGYSHSHNILARFNMSAESMLLVQVIAGLICAALAWSVVKAGIFIAVYHFVQANLSTVLVAALAERLPIPEVAYPLFAAVAGAAAAAGIAYLSTKGERIVVVAVTAAVGGFAAVSYFTKMIPVFPIDINFLNRVPAAVWLFAKVFLSAAGFMVQGPRKD